MQNSFDLPFDECEWKDESLSLSESIIALMLSCVYECRGRALKLQTLPKVKRLFFQKLLSFHKNALPLLLDREFSQEL
jgi:hypothetical protein